MSQAIQWYIDLMVCDHWVVSYTPITVISPETPIKWCMRGAPTHTKPTPGGKLGLGVLKGRVGVENFP